MELASRGVIFGKGNDMFKPQDHIIGEHVAYMMFNVMKVSIAENDKEFNPESTETCRMCLRVFGLIPI